MGTVLQRRGLELPRSAAFLSCPCLFSEESHGSLHLMGAGISEGLPLNRRNWFILWKWKSHSSLLIECQTAPQISRIKRRSNGAARLAIRALLFVIGIYWVSSCPPALGIKVNSRWLKCTVWTGLQKTLKQSQRLQFLITVWLPASSQSFMKLSLFHEKRHLFNIKYDLFLWVIDILMGHGGMLALILWLVSLRPLS